MPDLDDQIQDMDPSTMPDDDVVQQSPDTGDATATAADPSPATGAETDENDLLSVVRDVVDGNRKPEDQPASQAEPEDGSAAETPTNEDDDYSDVPFAKHPRFRKVLSERRDFKARAEAHEQDAVRYRNVQGFMDQNNLGAEEAADLLVIGGLIKTNPAEAWKRMKPTVQKLLVAAGEVLDPELAAKVQRGELNQNAALEISRSRALVNSTQASQSFQERRRQQEAQQTAAQSLQQTAADWEAERTQKDPNFAAKLPLIEREVAYLQRSEGVPNTQQGVTEQLAKAYKTVNGAFRAPQPAAPTPVARPAPKPAITPVRGGAVAGSAVQPKIEGTSDVIDRVVNRRRSA